MLAALVKATRAEEVECFDKLPVWDTVRAQECWNVTGRPLISTKCVDVSKGGLEDSDN